MTIITASEFTSLDERRAMYLRKVDEVAENTRMEHLTPGSGQSMTYEVKYQEALEGGGPMIEAEAEALEMTVQEVIDSVLLARTQWQLLGAEIEALRLKAKKDVRASATVGDMYQVNKAFKAAMLTLTSGETP